MSFLNPVFLSALTLVGIPLLIHLIRRRKLRTIRWAAMEFLLQSQRKQKRRLRIEELILLALRMLIVAMVALAFARPVLRAMGVPLLSQNARVYAILVLDNSLSMDHRSDGKRSFERAQAAANDILAHILKPGDAVSLVLLSDKPDAVIDAPSYDRDRVREQVRAAQVSDRATDYLAAVQTVNRLLKASRMPIKEVYWLTDDQANAWATSKRESARSAWGELGKQARITWVSVGAASGHRENLAVETPTLGRELVTPHLPERIEANIVNYGAQPRNNVLVNLFVDGRQAGSTRLSISPGGSEVARFITLFSHPGTHTGRVELADPEHIDGLARDNAAPFVVHARDRIHVLVQDTRPTVDPARSQAFYLMTAMAPNGAASSLAPKLHEGAGLGSANLREFDVVVVAGLGGLSASDRATLTEYVKAGGGALLFPGPQTDARRVNADLGASGLLPATLGAKRALSEDAALSLNPATITHPALAMFKDTSTLNLGTARFSTYFPLEPATDAADPNAVQVMVRFSNGDPAFIERKVGLGKVILAASGADATWNQLALKPSYVPFLYQTLSYLGQGPTSHRNLKQGEPLFLTLPVADANKPVRVTDPEGHVMSQNSVLDARGATFTYTQTQRAGLYKVAVAGSKTEDAFAVGLPPEESNLAPADPVASATQAGLPADHLTLAATPEQLQASVRRSRYGAEVWRPLIWIVLPLMFLESLLAQKFGRRG